MLREPIPRIDRDGKTYSRLRKCCRLSPGEIWEDPLSGHRVGVLDATSKEDIGRLMHGAPARLCISDPPYNLKLAGSSSQPLFSTAIDAYIGFSRKWVEAVLPVLAEDAHFYVWLGADQNDGFQPLPDFMIMMRDYSELASRSFITLRNQRGYGTQKNWMCIRQELLSYVKGKPDFSVVYTDIPKILRGYYKTVAGRRTENLERSRSDCIRAGNVWVDIQQVFYRMEENVPGAYAQKPLKAIERLITSSSAPGDLVLDTFAHAGTTLIAAERTERICFTCDLDPVYAELAIRRLERYRTCGKTGWQCENPFPEVSAEISTE